MPVLTETHHTSCADTLQQTRAYFDDVARHWDGMRHADERLIDEILDAAGVPFGGRVLDVACGTGILFPALLRRAPALLRAIDLSPAMVAIARQKYPGGEVAVSAEDFYTFNEGGFDCLIVYNAYPHFLNKAHFAQKAHSCLAPGGRLVVAHGCGRHKLNTQHQNCGARPVSQPLRPCRDEAMALGGRFHFDVMVDEADRYILSGTAR